MDFRIIIRFTDRGMTAYSPDYPDLNSTGTSVKEAEAKLRAAIEAHAGYLREQSERRWENFVMQHAELAS